VLRFVHIREVALADDAEVLNPDRVFLNWLHNGKDSQKRVKLCISRSGPRVNAMR
jgi:hypothetical protein